MVAARGSDGRTGGGRAAGPVADPAAVEISVVVPVLDGAPYVWPATTAIVAALSRRGRTFELIFVDDGSTDGTWDAIVESTGRDARVRGVRLAGNVGQAAAIAQGVLASEGAIVVTTDVDLEIDPEGLVDLVDLVGDDRPVVTGRRTTRRLWRREVPSRAFNALVRATGVPTWDLGCGTIAMARRAALAYAQVGDLGRELPAAVLVEVVGAVAEVPMRSRRPSESQLGPSDLVALWLAYEHRRGTQAAHARVLGTSAAVAAAGAVAGRRGPWTVPLVVGAASLAAGAVLVAAADPLLRRRGWPARAEVVARCADGVQDVAPATAGAGVLSELASPAPRAGASPPSTA